MGCYGWFIFIKGVWKLRGLIFYVKVYFWGNFFEVFFGLILILRNLGGFMGNRVLWMLFIWIV